jgi:hypothetical protein
VPSLARGEPQINYDLRITFTMFNTGQPGNTALQLGPVIADILFVKLPQ